MPDGELASDLAELAKRVEATVEARRRSGELPPGLEEEQPEGW